MPSRLTQLSHLLPDLNPNQAILQHMVVYEGDAPRQEVEQWVRQEVARQFQLMYPEAVLGEMEPYTFQPSRFPAPVTAYGVRLASMARDNVLEAAASMARDVIRETSIELSERYHRATLASIVRLGYSKKELWDSDDLAQLLLAFPSLPGTGSWVAEPLSAGKAGEEMAREWRRSWHTPEALEQAMEIFVTRRVQEQWNAVLAPVRSRALDATLPAVKGEKGAKPRM